MILKILRKTLILGSTSANFDAVNFPRTPLQSFLESGDFYQNKHKEQLLVNSSENIK